MNLEKPSGTSDLRAASRAVSENSPGAAAIAKYERLALSVENQIREANDSKKSETGIVAGIGDFVGEKTGAYSTGKEAYSGIVANAAAFAKELHAKIRAEFENGKILSDSEKTRVAELMVRLEKASGAKLEHVSWADAVTNSAGGDRSQTVRNVMKYSGARVVASVAEGAYEGVAGIAEITGKVLAMVATIPNPEARAVVAEELWKVLSNLTVENAKKVLVALPAVIEEFKKLPLDKQAEGAAKLVGMIVVPLGIGAKGVQAGKAIAETGIATAKAGTETAARAARIVAKQAERATGISERALKVAGKAATAGVAAMSIGAVEVAVAGTAVAAGTTVRYVGEMGAGGPKKAVAGAVETTAKNVVLAEKMTKAEARSGVLPETVLKNAALPDAERLALANGLLGRKLAEAQETTILRLHNDVSKGVYQNGRKELRTMVEELDKAGFSRAEERKLMENGVLGDTSVVGRYETEFRAGTRLFEQTVEGESSRIRSEINFWANLVEEKVSTWRWFFESEKKYMPMFSDELRRFSQEFENIFIKDPKIWTREEFDKLLGLQNHFSDIIELMKRGVNVGEYTHRFRYLENSIESIFETAKSARLAVNVEKIAVKVMNPAVPMDSKIPGAKSASKKFRVPDLQKVNERLSIVNREALNLNGLSREMNKLSTTILDRANWLADGTIKNQYESLAAKLDSESVVLKFPNGIFSLSQPADTSGVLWGYTSSSLVWMRSVHQKIQNLIQEGWPHRVFAETKLLPFVDRWERQLNETMEVLPK